MTDTSGTDTAVLIAGGGITGLSAALFLARQGIRTMLVERHPSTAIMPQARAFNPRTMEIYRSLGLAEEIAAHASLLAELPEMIGADTLAGAERFRVDLLEHLRPGQALSPADWAPIDQDELERIVLAHAERAGADIRFGTELCTVDTDDSGVRATVRGPAGDYELRAGYLIAADGHRAGIRAMLGVGAEHATPPAPAAYAVFDADLTHVLRDRRFLLAYLEQPVQGTVLVPLRASGRWMLGLPYEPERGEPTEQDCVAAIRTAVGDPGLAVTLVPPVPGLPEKVAHSTGGCWVAQRYAHGRVFFAGDAAHVLPPAGSYGASTGIADAHNLCWKLAAVLGGHAGPELLDTYEQERRPVAESTVDTVLTTLRNRWTSSGAEVTAVDDIAMIFGYRYASAAVYAGPTESTVDDPRVPTGAPGLRAPHVWLQRAGARISTIDLFDGGFTLLAGPAGAAWIAAAERVADGLPLTTWRIGADLTDVDGTWASAYGVTGGGATLVRPDGFVAWRSVGMANEPERELGTALDRILHRADGAQWTSERDGQGLAAR